MHASQAQRGVNPHPRRGLRSEKPSLPPGCRVAPHRRARCSSSLSARNERAPGRAYHGSNAGSGRPPSDISSHQQRAWDGRRCGRVRRRFRAVTPKASPELNGPESRGEKEKVKLNRKSYGISEIATVLSLASPRPTRAVVEKLRGRMLPDLRLLPAMAEAGHGSRSAVGKGRIIPILSPFRARR